MNKKRIKRISISIIIGLIFTISYFLIYRYIGGNSFIKSLSLSLIPFFISIIVIFIKYSFNKLNSNQILKYSTLTISVICLIIYFIGIIFTSDEVIGFYLVFTPFIFILFYIAPLFIMNLIILKYLFKNEKY